MSNSNKKSRKYRSDKFPLTLHKTGQYCKKIKGKIYYFGSDRRIALQRYLGQASELHMGSSTQNNSVKECITIEDLSNLYLEYQDSRVQSGQMTADHYRDQLKTLREFVRFLGQNSMIYEICTLDLQSFKKKLVKKFRSAHRINLNISIMKAMFHWAKKNEVVEKIPNIDAVSKVQVVKRRRPTFTPEQIGILLKNSNVQMRAMILLGLNCGFGCTDCACLRWTDIDFKRQRVRLARKKTGVDRNLPLWPETIASLKNLKKLGELVFYTSKGNPCVRTIVSKDENGITKYTNDNFISKKFLKLKKTSNIKTEKGVGFYTLRRTAATLAAHSGDPFAVQRLLGHADLKMATTYVQDVSEQTDRAINNSRKLIIRDDS